MANLTLQDGRTISFPDGLQPDQVKKIVSAATMQGGMKSISDALPDASTDTQAYQAQREYDDAPGWSKPLIAAEDLLNLAGDSASFGWASKAAAAARSGIRGTSYEDERGAIDKRLADARARSGLPGLATEIGAGVAGPLKLAQKGLTFTRVPGPVGKYGGLAADGAVLGGVGAAGNDQDWMTGAAIGGGLGLAGDLAVKGIGKLVSPLATSPERKAAADVLRREGVSLSAGQRTGNEKLRFAESELGGAKSQNLMEAQGQQFTRAALKRVGENADRATPDVIDNAFKRIGGEFDRLSQNPIIPSQQMAGDLTQAGVDYASRLPTAMRIPLIEKTLTDVIGLLQTGRMDGKVYKSLRSELDRFARGTSQPEAKQAARDIIEILDNGMEQSIAQLNPRDLGKWRQVRKQYRNILVIEQAATGAGENAALGLISPSKLRQATVTKQGRRNYARGSGDFTDLARSGEALMKPLPQSGTAPRMAARGIGAAIGAPIGYQEDGGMGAAQGALLGMAAPWAAGRLLMSGPVQGYAGNQAMAKMTPEAQAALARALTALGMTSLLGSHQ